MPGAPDRQERARRRRPAYVKVADALRQSILDGTYVEGDRLPSEGDLATEFEVSRSTVREALRVLASHDLVYTARGTMGGTYVAQVRVSEISDYLATSIGLMRGADRIAVEDILLAREVLEIPSVTLAARKRTVEQVAAMREALVRERTEPRSKGRFAKHRTFHQIIAEASHNPLLEMMSEPVFRVLETKFFNPSVPESVYEGLAHDHEGIIDAIEAGDSDEAARLMTQHLATLRQVYVDRDLDEVAEPVATG